MNASPNPIAINGQVQSAQGPRAQPAKTRINRNRRDSGAEKRNPAQRYLAKLAPSSRRTLRWALTEMGKIWKRHPVKDGSRLAWNRIKASDVDLIREVLAAKFAPVTANTMLVALRQVLRFCWHDKSLLYEDFLRLSDVDSIKGESPARGRALGEAELDRLYGACGADRTPAGARDGAAIALAHAAGLRCAEIVGLDVADIVDPATGELLVRGKGGTVSGASLGAGAVWLQAWLAVRGPEPGPVLFQVLAHGKIARHRLSPAAVFRILAKRAKQAGIKDVSPHCLRKTFATSLFRAGFDHVMVMRSLRHRDIRSVRIYDRRTEDERAAAQRAAIRVPGRGR